MKVMDKAKELAKAINESEEYKAFQKSIKELEADKKSEEMVRELKKKQFEIQRASNRGEKASEELVRESQELYHSCIVNQKIANFFQAEFKFTKLMEDVQKIIADSVDN